MSARTRTVALAAVGAVGLVLLAYGVGGAVGGGSASAVGASDAATPQQQEQQQQQEGYGFARDAAEDNGTAPRRHPCPHHDGEGQGSGSGSGGDSSTQAAPGPNAY